tara:strand:+ start:1689 stop:1955 length:267 start_codon:yes stop_codon:yes gene_type:complete
MNKLTIKEQIEMEILGSFRDISSTLKKIRNNQVILNLELTDTLRDITTIIDSQLHNNNMVVVTWHEEEIRIRTPWDGLGKLERGERWV